MTGPTGLPSERTMVARILRTFDRASESELRAGSAWYLRGRAEAVRIVRRPVDESVAVVAALSPRQSWSRNLEAADILARAAEAGARLPVVGLRSNALKAWRILHGEAPADILRGDKVTRFALNLLGDESVVTVDVWAARIAGVEADRLTTARYLAVERAYQVAARQRGVSPATMQATTWVVARGSAE